MSGGGVDEGAIDRQMSVFLYWVFVPASLTFVGGWAVFRLFLDGLLLAYGLSRIVPRSGVGAVESGWGRFLLLVGLSVTVTIGLFVLRARLDDGFPPTTAGD